MLRLCSMLLCLISCCVAIEEGNLCEIKSLNTSGICKSINNCPYAMKLLYVDEKKPPMCKWVGDTRIVCCPSANIIYKTGLFGRFYEASNSGVKRSTKVTCYYNGNQPILCCPNKPEIRLPEETGCPALHKPKLAVEHIAWKKCVEYQRFVDRCVARKGDPDSFIRVDTCGIPNDRYRISGGNPAMDKEFPHMALIGCAVNVGENTDVQWIGGGSLISDRYILTAGHVLIDPSSRPVRYALLGTLNKTDTVNSLLFNIVRKIPHPLYSTRTHDIALVELERRVIFSEFVRPACLPVPGRDIHENSRIIAGWGRTTQFSNPSDILYTTDITETTTNDCQTKFEAKHFHFNASTMICAKGEIRDAVSDSCEGDSGGPLMALLNDVKCSYSVEGVVSFGPRCGEGAAGIYTRVEPYMDWIVSNVWPEEYNSIVPPLDIFE